jgi:predicted nucleic acid-binding protein
MSSYLSVYLDNCCFNRPYDVQNSPLIKLETEAKLYIQTAIYSSKIDLVWSFMLDFENAANPYPDHREAIAEWKKLATIDIKALETVRKHAHNIEISAGIKPKDALHLACAIEAHCDYFITTDKSLLKKSQILKEIKTVNPIDLILTLEELK